MQTFIQWVEAAYKNKKNCPYWGDAGSGVIPIAKNTGRLLINKRSLRVNEGGTYGVYGGGIFLDKTNFSSTEELAQSNYPQQHALRELEEETGYDGPMQLQEIFVYKDSKKNSKGEPCNFYYWNFAGICPEEFSMGPLGGYEWESETGWSPTAGWLTLTEVIAIQPKHFGLTSVLQNAGNTLAQIVRSLGFRGDEKYPRKDIT